MSDSPYDVSFKGPTPGIIKQELITYEISDGWLVKRTVSRTFFPNDYIDSQSVERLAPVAPNEEDPCNDDD